MYRYIPLILLATLLACVFVAMPSGAAEDDWIKGCDVDGSFDLNTTPVTTLLQPGEVACAESITQTNVTDELNVSQCNHIDVIQYDDADGDGDVSTVTGTPQVCPDARDDDDSCTAMGLVAFVGDTFLEGLGARFFRVASGGTTDTAPVRWEVRCVGRAREK